MVMAHTAPVVPAASMLTLGHGGRMSEVFTGQVFDL